MSKTKIALSAKELEMVNDREWILTKQRIIQQVYVLLESVVADIDSILLPDWRRLSKHNDSPPRIFKGENYLGLPYVTLDYPRLFESENTLTVRTMFWWGHFVSVTLHAGEFYKTHIIDKIAGLPATHKSFLYLCVHENQWHHYFEADNYILLSEVSKEQWQTIRSERTFIKLAYKSSLQRFNELPHELVNHYKMLAEIIA